MPGPMLIVLADGALLLASQTASRKLRLPSAPAPLVIEVLLQAFTSSSSLVQVTVKVGSASACTTTGAGLNGLRLAVDIDSGGGGKGRLTSDVSVPAISLDPVRPADEPFLYHTYASTRAGEMALTGWHPEQQEVFLCMQYEAQRRSYRTQMPNAEYWVIRCDKIAAGRLIVDRTPEEIRLVDIALLPEFRTVGIGSALMAAIMKEASQAAKAVSLHVERFNPALRWYERLGFSIVSTGPIYLEMVWPGNGLAATLPQASGSERNSGAAYVDSSDQNHV